MNNEIVPIDYCNETISLKKTIESGFIVLAERLHNIKQSEMWSVNWSSWGEYLEELNITETTASKLITVFNTFIEGRSIPQEDLIDVGWSNLYEVKSLVSPDKDDSYVLDLVKKTSVLKQSDVREMIRESRHGECDHDWYEIHIKQCSLCNKREKLYNE